MKRRKRNILLKRIVALIMAVTMLPFADYGQVFAYSGQNSTIDLSNEQTAVSENTVKEYSENQNSTQEQKENNGQQETNVEENQTEERDNGEKGIETQEEVTKETSGLEKTVKEPWIRITKEELEHIQHATFETYEEKTIDSEALVLTEDLEVGNLYINGESLDLNGYTLIVYGDLLQTGGEVRLNGGKLIVGKDYRIQTREEKENPQPEEDPYIYKESNGKLVMTEETDYLVVCGSFYTDSTVSHEGSLTAGIMEVMGNFTQLSSQSTENFMATESHKVIFSGEENKEVTFSTNTLNKSQFSNVEIGCINQSENSTDIDDNQEMETEDKPILTFTGNPYVSGEITDTKSHTVIGKIGIGSTTGFTDGYFGGGAYILEQYPILQNKKITLEGDIEIAAKVSIYGILETKGNVLVTQSGISMEGGELLVGNNLTVKAGNHKDEDSGLKMYHDEDYVLVGGDFLYQPWGKQNLSAGVLEIKGNATIEKEFQANGSHKTVFSGEKKQVISMADGMYFHILELKNESPEGVYSEKILSKNQLIRNGCQLTYGEMEGSFGYTLKQDEVIEGDFILLDDTLDLNGYSLRIKGNLVQTSGVVVINGGLLTVEGDYRQQGMTTTSNNSQDSKTSEAEDQEKTYGVSNGYLQMTNEADQVLINGSMYVETTADTTGKLTNGVLEVKGDFIQKKTEGFNNFKASDNHTLVLSGEEKQTLNMEYSILNGSQICNLEMKNAGEQGVVIENRPYIAGMITDSNKNTTGQIAIGSNTQFVKGYFGGSVYTLGEIAVRQNLDVCGNMDIAQNVSIYADLTVRGNVVVNPGPGIGGISMEGGKLTVGKNLTINQYTYGIKMANDNDYILVYGDFTYQPRDKWDIKAGTLEIKGNVNIVKNFFATGTHKTILSGKSKQTVTMADGMYFHILELQNYSEEGIYSEKTLQKSQLIRNGCKISYGTTEGNYGETLEEDKVVEGDYILLDDILDLNGHSLTIKGDFVQPAGEVYINGGTLIVEGDYRQQSTEANDENEATGYGVSSGLLRMEKEEDHVLIKGSMYIESAADTTGKLKNGVLEIKGDFIQKKTTKLTNFAPSDNHVLLLSGEGKQTVNMEYSASGNSHIENLEITNSSADGITFENSPYIAGIIKSQQGQNTAGQIKIGSGTTLPAFYPGDVCSLEEITIKEGEEVAIGGNLEFTQNLSIYGSLSVGGNVDVKPVNYTGGIIMEGGSLKVGENLTVHPQFNQNYGIQMTHESDYLLVGGNFTYNPEYEWKFNAGTLELKGDVDIKSCFHADGTHKTILSGESKQTVTMADGMYFHILELQNYSEDGVYSDNAIQKSQLIRNGCKLTYGNMAGSYGYTLEQDQIIESDFTLVDDVLDLNGHTLTIKGDLIQSGGEVFVNGGKLIVEGDYRQQSYNSTEKSYGVSSGLLHMENEADYVLVSGNMYIQTTAVTTGKLANGVLEVKGDFIQKKTSTLANFNPSDSHILLLSGQVKQTVSMEYTAIGSSHIQNLQITNNNEMGISFQNCPYVAGTITSQKGQTVAGQVGIGTSTILQNGYYPGDICILQEITVKEDEQMEIGGNLKITQNLSIFGSVQVDGNIEVRPAGFNGGIIMEGGSLKVGKNLEIYPENTLICGIQMLHESDYILVKGDFSYNPGYEWDLTAGTLELKGNANISTCFHAKNKHKTILSGESKQTITMADGMYFNILEIQNYSEEGVYSETALQKTQLIRNGCKLTYGDMEGSYGYTLEKDETIEEDFILIDDVLNLNGHTLTIKGDFIQPGGEIFVNGGALIVEGDYRQQSKNTAESGENENYGVSSGLLHMKNEDDYVLIKGNMYVETKADTVGKLTNGTLEVKGDFVQKKTATLSNFNSSHSHTLVLSGEEKQTVTMEYTDDKNSYITNLEIDNNSEGGIVFENSPYVAGNITAQKGQKAAGQIRIGTNTRLQNGYFPGDVRIVQGIVINAEDEYEIGGNLEINQKLSICGSLCVGGNIDVKPSNYLGAIVMQGGSLKVEKNLNTYVTCNVSYGIQMIHESDYIFVGGDFNYGPGNELALTAGTLELKGNADITSCFHAKGTHKTILSGESKQTITMADGMYFNILELQNYSDEGVYSQKALQKAKLIRNGCKLTYGDMKDGVYGFTLQDDYVAEGNLILIDDVMDLNGHTLTIRGNLIQAGGEILINGGTLIVEGDYRQQTQKTVNGNSTYEASSGFLTMTNENDTVEIAGDFIMQQVSGVEGHFTKGTLNIKGNFQQIGANGFVAEKNHTVCFNGEETQKFINETNGIIGNLTIKNTSKMGVVQSSQNKVLGTVTDLNNQLSGSGNLIIDNFSQLAEGNCGGNVTITGENTLESNIEIEGIITVDGTCKLNGYELCANACTINGSLYVEGGSLLLTSYLNVAKKGYFVMTDAKGYAFVNGDMTFATKNSHSGLLTNGILEVKGDFTQKAAANFIATENHTTILSKKTTTTGRIMVQTISFSHPGEARFHKLILKKSLKTGYIFNNTPETIADEVIYEVTDETAPGKVEQVSVGNITASTIHISYVAATDNNAVAGYEIYRNGKKIAVTNTLSYTDTGLTPETTYTYTVYAFDEDKNLSEASKEVQATTLADELAPDQVTGLSVISSAGSSITLSWKPSADNVKTTHYTLYRDGELVADNLERTKYTDSGLKENKLYIYTITASDKAGNVSQISEEVHGVVTMPKFTYVSPEDYATIGGEQVMLEARFSSAGNSIGNKVVMEYLDEEKEIWKQITPTPLGQKVYDSSQYYVSYPWDISGFAEEKEIDVRFTLTDKDGKSKETLVTYSLDRTAPNPPRNLQITDSEGALKLTWDRSTSADVAGTIIRRQKDEGAFEIIADITDVDMEWYIDKDVETGAIYTYTLQCYDEFGQRGTLSSSATDSPLPDESAPTIEDMLPVSSAVGQTISIQVKAKDNRKVENISLYGKYKEEEKWQFIVEKQAENDQIAYELDTANYTEGEYQIKAVAKDKAGNTNEELCFRTYTIDHTGISKIMLEEPVVGSTAVKLTWKDVTEEDFGWFRVEKLENGEFIKVEDISDTLGYVVDGLLPNTTYTFRVVGYDRLENRGEASEELTVTTTLDTVGPTILAVFPATAAYNNTIALQLKAQDNYGIDKAIFSYSLDETNYEEIATIPLTGKEKEGTLTYDWDVSAIPEGKVSVKFEAYDIFGNHNLLSEEETEIIVSYTIDRTAPEKIKNMKAEGGEGYAKLTWDACPEEDIAGFRIYRAEEENGVYRVINDLSTTKDYYDSQVEEGMTYFYKVAAVDNAGNEGECSKESGASINKDKEAPVITGIAPVNGTLLGEASEIEMLAMDNTKVASVKLEYREKDSKDIWHTLGEETAEERLAYQKVSWNAKGLSEGKTYELRASAVDKSGNMSEYVTSEYSFDLTAPEKPQVEAKSGSFSIQLSYSKNTEEDFSIYHIYRKAYGEKEFVCIQTTTENSYTDTQVETNTIYYYQIWAYDTQGNYSRSDTVHSYANDIDTVAPTVNLPENIVALNGIETVFDATGSSDNVRIVKYTWDMGDGTIKTGSKFKYTYKEPGTYQVMLTVEDAAGNESSTVCNAIVKNRDKNGIATIKVQTNEGLPIQEAAVVVKIGEEEYLRLQTDSNGKVDICTLAGVYEYSIYKEGYMPIDGTVYVSNQELNEDTQELQDRWTYVTLESGEVVTGDFSVRRMELAEMIAEGVDFSDPANYHTYTFRVTLTFAQNPIPFSNNLSENAIRPVTVGRRNWLFCDSTDGADASMMVYSLLETARANGLNPQKYLEYLLEARPNENMSDEELENMAPWDPKVQECCVNKS